MNMLVLLTALLAAGLASVYFFAGRMRFLDVLPRSRWLSVAGGISVAYVLVHLLPEERESRFWAFALGAALYAAILLVAF